MPVSTLRRRTTSATMAAAPSARTNASATSSTASPSRSRTNRPPAVAWPPASLVISWTSMREAASAGAMPNNTAVARHTARRNANARQSSAISWARGIVAAPSATSTPVPHRAMSAPMAPPASASNTLSARNCLTSRPRLAPSAARVTTSRARTVIRASSRFATFAHAAASTSPTAAKSIHRDRRIEPSTTSETGTTRTPTRAAVPRNCSSKRAAMTRSSAAAASGDTPAFRRPMTLSRPRRAGPWAWLTNGGKGTQTSVRDSTSVPGNSDPAA